MESDSRENFTKSTSDMENAIQACNQKKKKPLDQIMSNYIIMNLIQH